MYQMKIILKFVTQHACRDPCIDLEEDLSIYLFHMADSLSIKFQRKLQELLFPMCQEDMKLFIRYPLQLYCQDSVHRDDRKNRFWLLNTELFHDCDNIVRNDHYLMDHINVEADCLYCRLLPKFHLLQKNHLVYRNIQLCASSVFKKFV